MKRKLIIEIISSLLIFLFVYTAFSKLNEYNSFKAVLHKSPLIGDYAAVVALALPITEGLVSLLLFIPRTRLWGLYASLAFMSVFTLYLAYMIYFTPHLPCSCGGVLKQMTWNQHFISMTFLLLVPLTGVVWQRKHILNKELSMTPIRIGWISLKY